MFFLQEMLMKIDTVIRLTQDCPLTKTDDAVLAWLCSWNILCSVYQPVSRLKCFIHCLVCTDSRGIPFFPLIPHSAIHFCFIPEQWVLRDIPLQAFLFGSDRSSRCHNVYMSVHHSICIFLAQLSSLSIYSSCDVIMRGHQVTYLRTHRHSHL